LGGDVYVRTITTLATPHHGSVIADWAMNNIGLKFKITSMLEYIGIPYDAFLQLTPKYCEEQFNPHTPDHSGVSYFSYGAKKVSMSPVNPLYFFHKTMSATEKENDGLVSVKSATWGEYLSTLEADHIEIINWSPFFDASNIYLRAAKFLIEHEDEIEQQQDKAAAQQQLPNLPAPLAVLPLTPS